MPPPITLSEMPAADHALRVQRSAQSRWLALLLLAWAALVVAVYFRRVWPLIGAGPAAWVIPDVGQSLRFTGLPYLREAMLRALSAASAAAIVLAAIAGVGGLVNRWLLPESATRTD